MTAVTVGAFVNTRHSISSAIPGVALANIAAIEPIEQKTNIRPSFNNLTKVFSQSLP